MSFSAFFCFSASLFFCFSASLSFCVSASLSFSSLSKKSQLKKTTKKKMECGCSGIECASIELKKYEMTTMVLAITRCGICSSLCDLIAQFAYENDILGHFKAFFSELQLSRHSYRC